MGQHDQHDVRGESLRCAILTISDTRTPTSDASGTLVRELIQQAGYVVHSYEIIPDESIVVADRVRNLCDAPTCRAVLLTGGTGLAARDSTIEAITPLFEKRIDGFGELFRVISFEEIGPAAMLSRATAGVRNRKAIFAMPGSPNAVRTAMTRLILPQLPHLVGLLGSAECGVRSAE